MTDEAVEQVATRVAARGHEALVERLRGAFAEAAAAHADLIVIDPDKLEALVQRSASHADGLQWRRALAGVAADELGIDVSEALGHPAVARAQQLVGAPSYEDSLAELIRRPVPETADAALTSLRNGRPAGAVATPPEAPAEGLTEAPAETDSEAETAAVAPTEVETDVHAAPEAETAALAQADADLGIAEAPAQAPPAEAAPDTEAETAAPAEAATGLETETETAAPETELQTGAETTAETTAAAETPADAAATAASGEAATAPGAVPAEEALELRATATHLGGVANLTTNQSIDVRLWRPGLDIMEGEETIVGRLPWEDIEALEVPVARGRPFRRGGSQARLIVRTPSGDASFDFPTLGGDELRDHVRVLVERFGRR